MMMILGDSSSPAFQDRNYNKTMMSLGDLREKVQLVVERIHITFEYLKLCVTKMENEGEKTMREIIGVLTINCCED